MPPPCSSSCGTLGTTCFRDTLGFTERSLVSELRGWRNKWAHQERFSSDDADRALDSAERLLTAVSAPQADEVAKIKRELRRLVLDEQVRGERRRVASAPVETAAGGAVKPWREVATPHRDVASGRYQQAEFAADLWQVHLGEGADEYRDAGEFFRRTFLTESLQGLLATGLRRLAGKTGDPVVQLQTNFGGGKTHSMLALYHLFSGAPPQELAGGGGGAGQSGSPRRGTSQARGAGGQQKSPPAIRPRSRIARWCALSGANWPISLAVPQRSNESAPMTRTPLIPAMPCGNCCKPTAPA